MRVNYPSYLRSNIVRIAKPSRRTAKEECWSLNHPAARRAFTLVELIVILGLLALFGSIMATSLAKTSSSSKGYQCLSNLHRLTVASRMYSEENQDRLPYASTSGPGGPPDANPLNPDNYAWTGAHLDGSGANRGNWDPTYDMVKRPLWPYTRNQAIYKCPSDHTTVTAAAGVKPRILSMAMNVYMGGFAPTMGFGPDGTDGGWAWADPYRIFSKAVQINPPSKIFVFTDMRPETLNWGSMMVDMSGCSNAPAQYSFFDFPGILHEGGGNFTFADGHGELHRWLDPRTATPLSDIAGSPWPSPNNVDIAWLQDHATHPK